MKNYRMFLLGFVIVSCVFLSGFNRSFANMTVGDEQKIIAEIKSEEDLKRVDQAYRETKLNPLILVKATDNRVDDSEELKKPLDLSLPFKASENIALKNQQAIEAKTPEADLFSSETKKKRGPLQLNGDLLMSPEPEAEKRKSVDGAGIIINLKP